ncbi:MAG TPA: porphobilinogen synthase [Bacillota bacterium]|mgnify:FL=1|nr:porphobilinogen synthase [Peptococcaceae bacterium MAG4]NLW38673.1 porphobilinogen synthase [Peptococcaceae bacterium]HPU35564.1 porphobilinogen synthase [Bacillota bacterium]HPZ42623.1 porphobilinogen synthase [Bacillota bacterium]HQD75626.1 porphobilinogen synthase [Bacillota bacterium]
MSFPVQRPRRLRSNENIRRMVRETVLSVDDLVYPVFVTHGKGVARPVESMPGIYNYSIDMLLKHLEKAARLKIPGILPFGIPATKDEVGSEAYAEDGIIQQAVRAIKEAFPDFLVITDICLCEYTSHGHCGLIQDGRVANDPTLDLLARTAVSHAAAGADMVAPSDMMDGRVGAIRRALDKEGFESVPIMAYSAKYASAFYGPFRDAAGSAPQFGDRKAYQMDPANSDEALREVWLDIEEGADIVMVKPALAYMDVIRRVKDEFGYPVAAYNVSGEYSMIKAAAQKGWVDERRIVMETLTGIKRAGADIVITYYALDVAEWLRE